MHCDDYTHTNCLHHIITTQASLNLLTSLTETGFGGSAATLNSTGSQPAVCEHVTTQEVFAVCEWFDLLCMFPAAEAGVLEAVNTSRQTVNTQE